MEISNQTQKTWKTKILIQRIAMGTHLTETKSEKNPWTPKETDQTSMFCKGAVSKGLGRPEVLMTMVSLFDVYIPKKHRTYVAVSLPDFLLPVSMGLSILWKSVWSYHQKFQLVTTSKWQSHWGFSTRPNYKLESPCRWMTMACCSRCSKIECTWREIFWERKTYKKNRVKNWCFLATLKKKVLFFLISRI